MDIAAQIILPDHIYQFYAQASRCVRGRTPEEVMADALRAYAQLLSRETPGEKPEDEIP